MSSRSSLSCLDKREILNRTSAPVNILLEWGKHYEEVDQPSDSIDFYAKAGSRTDLERLVARVIEDGDFFLLNRLCRELGRQPSREELTAVAEKAEALGKVRFAEGARALLQEKSA
jgi:hypothetical protein